jgi:outer membrane protein assembly factor BamA
LAGAEGFENEPPTLKHSLKPLNSSVPYEVSEGAQYRVRTVKIYGVEDGAKNRLVDRLEPGRVFDASALTRFREDDERSVDIHRDTHDRTVDIVIDVRKTGCIESARQKLNNAKSDSPTMQ